MRASISLPTLVVVLFLASQRAQGACGSTTFQPISQFVPAGTTHNAYYLTDPAGEQRAVFDLVWGGALASLKQGGAERVWGHATGGMVQPAFHTFPNGVDYNPTQAGDKSNKGSAVMGVRCIDSNTLYIMSGTLDYNRGAGGLIISNTVLNGAVVSNSYATPYTVVTIARFVPNPSAPPSYYLKLENTITNIHPTSNLPFGFELAGYVPYSFSSTVRYPTSCAGVANNCYNSDTPDLLGGLYPTSALTGGTAFFVSPQASWDPGQRTFVDLKTDDINQNQSAHLFTENWVIPPGSSRKITWYVLVGSWSKALNFASLN